ncbi:MAG: M23 family metallopeptidase, partial [Opitutaceae bacterium]|nr:M23 family metallopeptidase [Opitutaceae bacterium]
MKLVRACFFPAAFLLASLLHAARTELVWPTPNTAFFDGRPVAAFIQPTASGVVESGLYGGVRNGGARFHEGVDLLPLKRDRQGEPVDPVFAAMPGVVRHVSTAPGNSSYGRYIVIEHPGETPAVYTLYAHLRAVEPGIAAGAEVARGQRIATMGRSSSVAAIPKARAHLHFEIGVRLTRDFQRWYDAQKFNTPNKHGIWNGMNLMGLDPLDFCRRLRAGAVADFQDYFRRMKPAARLRIASGGRTPDFVERYLSLLTKPLDAAVPPGGWEIAFNETGIPFAWTPLQARELADYKPGEARVLAVDAAVL